MMCDLNFTNPWTFNQLIMSCLVFSPTQKVTVKVNGLFTTISILEIGNVIFDVKIYGIDVAREKHMEMEGGDGGFGFGGRQMGKTFRIKFFDYSVYETW